MRNKEYFRDEIKTLIIAHLPSSYSNAEVNITDVAKNNTTRMGLSIKRNGDYITPLLYIDDLCDSYICGDKTIDECLSEIADKYVNAMKDAKSSSIETEMITDWDKVKSLIKPKLVSINSPIVKDRIHKELNDMAVVYYVNIGLIGDSTATVPVTTTLADVWGKSLADIHNVAMENCDEPVVRSISEILMEDMIEDGMPRELAEIMFESMNVPLICVTNKSALNGAICLFKAIDELVERCGDTFYVIPSSIHEVLIYPTSEDMTVEEIKQMVVSINANDIPDEDILTDSVYLYSNGTLTIAA